MLGKVMKYEMRASGRLLLPLFGLALGFSAALRLLFFVAPLIWEPAGNFISGIASFLGSILVIGVILFSFVYSVVRFWQSMLASEGYTTFSLPVKPGTHIAGRFLVGTLYSLLGVITAVLSAFIFTPGFASAFFESFTVASFGGSGQTTTLSLADLPFSLSLSLIGLIVLFILLTITSNLIKFYASMALGTQIGQNRLLGSILGYILINIVEAIILMPLMFTTLFNLFGRTNSEFMGNIQSIIAPNAIDTFSNVLGYLWMFAGALGVFIVIISAAQYFLTRWCFGKRLNLE